MYRPVLITAPATAPITLAEAKLHLRVDTGDTSQDAVITALLAAALAHLDGWTGILGRCLITQSWRQDFDCLEYDLRLPLAPVTAITSVKYDDPDGVEQTISSSYYSLQTDGLGSFVRFKTTYVFSAINYEKPAVRVVYVAGDANAAAVPQAIKQAMLLLIGAWFENREESVVGTITSALPNSVAVNALLAPYRRIRF